MIEPENIGMPSMGGPKSSKKLTMEDYSVKYLKADMSDRGEVAILEAVETRAIHGTDIVLIDKDKFTFMDKYFIILKYLEKNT